MVTLILSLFCYASDFSEADANSILQSAINRELSLSEGMAHFEVTVYPAGFAHMGVSNVSPGPPNDEAQLYRIAFQWDRRVGIVMTIEGDSEVDDSLIAIDLDRSSCYAGNQKWDLRYLHRFKGNPARAEFRSYMWPFAIAAQSHLFPLTQGWRKTADRFAYDYNVLKCDDGYLSLTRVGRYAAYELDPTEQWAPSLHVFSLQMVPPGESSALCERHRTIPNSEMVERYVWTRFQSVGKSQISVPSLCMASSPAEGVLLWDSRIVRYETPDVPVVERLNELEKESVPFRAWPEEEGQGIVEDFDRAISNMFNRIQSTIEEILR